MRPERGCELDLRYAAGQVARAHRYLREGKADLAEDAINRAQDALTRAGDALASEAAPAAWDTETILRREG